MARLWLNALRVDATARNEASFRTRLHRLAGKDAALVSGTDVTGSKARHGQFNLGDDSAREVPAVQPPRRKAARPQHDGGDGNVLPVQPQLGGRREDVARVGPRADQRRLGVVIACGAA
jgi:hypothetical protein